MIVTSLLDNDFYKFTMMQAVLHQFPGARVRYEYKCRNESSWTESKVKRLASEIECIFDLRFKEEELEYLAGIRFLKQDFIDYLRMFQFDKDRIDILLDGEELKITIEGPWLTTILFEVPILAIVNEVYFENEYPMGGPYRLSEKLQLAYDEDEFIFTDFGTRRRYSKDWQRMVVWQASKAVPKNFIGTSNVLLAKEFNIKALGTMAHEWIMAGQGLGFDALRSQSIMLQKWEDEYRGDLGIALSDTLGLDAFLRDFDLYFAKLYDGVRHDSGNPIEWGEKIISHYELLGIDPRTKTMIFSDSLNMVNAIEIFHHFKDRIKVSFGIGTNLTNDFDNITPLQHVIKMVECNSHPVAKISDDPGKGMCKDKTYLNYLNKIFKIGDNNE